MSAQTNNTDRDCVLYAILKEDEDLYVEYNDDGSFKDIVFPDKYKRLYIGQTNNFELRMCGHKGDSKSAIKQRKLYNCIRKYGWDAFTKLIIADNLTRSEVNDREPLEIEKYNSYRQGLNSAPGGLGHNGLAGTDHPRAKGIRIFNNSTKEELRFDFITDGAIYMGVKKDLDKGLRRDNQMWSPNHNAWFQIKYAEDDTEWDYEMKSPKNDKPIWVRSVEIEEDATYFDSITDAANYHGIAYENIAHVVNGRCLQFSASGGKRYDAQFDILPLREWRFGINHRLDTCNKAVFAFIEGDVSETPIYSFKSARVAGDETGIHKASITNCVNHTSQTAGKYNGKKLQWEFQDKEHRAEIDKKRPRHIM
jgi:group I intron endonuclease